MNKLNENYVYSLEELTSEELKELWIYLTKVDEDWADCPFEEMIKHQKKYRLLFNTYNWSWRDSIEPTHNAKELFYTLENVQVDCSELSEEQIKEMCEVFIKNGYDYYSSEKYALNRSFDSNFLICRKDIFYITNKQGFKHKITYEKFMELFTEPQYEVKMIVEAPKPEHYAKGIDTFARMEANCTTEECLAFAKGNIDKYNFRTKGQDLEDYKKIVSYANWAIKLLENAKNN